MTWSLFEKNYLAIIYNDQSKNDLKLFDKLLKFWDVLVYFKMKLNAFIMKTHLLWIAFIVINAIIMKRNNIHYETHFYLSNAFITKLNVFIMKLDEV